MQSWPYIWLARNVIPYIRFNIYYTYMRGSKYKEGYKLLKAGHILLSRDHMKLTSWIIGGVWCHAALCVGKGDEQPYEVAEMTHSDYTKSEFYDLCREADRVMILECTDWDEDYIKNVVVPACMSWEDVDYDLQFEFGIKSLYCSELIYQADVEKRLKVSLEDHAMLGHKYVSPTGIYKAENVRVVWDSRDVPLKRISK